MPNRDAKLRSRCVLSHAIPESSRFQFYTFRVGLSGARQSFGPRSAVGPITIFFSAPEALRRAG
jgi:hypothetical protein